MNVKDINVDESYNITTRNGDFEVLDSDKTHINLILRSYINAFKEFPLVGVGIDQYLASSGSEQLIKRNITVQLNNDNYKVNSINRKLNVDIDQYEFYIDAARIK